MDSTQLTAIGKKRRAPAKDMRLNIANIGGAQIAALASIALITVAVACGTESPPIPDLEATVVARVRATMEALPPATAGVVETPTSTPAPTRTPQPTPVPTPTPTATAVPSPTATATGIPRATATPVATPTSAPAPTPTAVPLPAPSATPAPVPTPTLAELIQRSLDSVVRIISDRGEGSGVVVDASGRILTANHLLEGVSTVIVELATGVQITGTVLGRHYPTDIALVAIPTQGLPAMPIGTTVGLGPGDFVMKAGYVASPTQGGAGPVRATVGKITSVTPDTRLGATLVQTDLGLEPGDAGGPLLDGQGRLIAISSSVAAGTSIDGVSHATGVDQAIADLGRLAAGETVCQATPTSTGESRFRNSVFEYYVDIPPSWEWEQLVDGSTTFFRRERVVNIAKDSFRSSGVAVFVDDSPDRYATLGEYLGFWLTELEDTYTSIDVLGRQLVCGPIAGMGDALQVEARVIRETTPYFERWLLFFTGGRGYLLEGFAWEEKWAAQEGLIDALSYSFSFER